MTKRSIFIRTLAVALGCFLAADARATVGITTATGGTSLTADRAQNSTTPLFTTLGNIVITEGANADFMSQSGTSLILSAPSGWRFNAGVGSVSQQNGRDISSSVISVSASTITVTITVTGIGKADVLTISGIQVQATDGGVLPASGNIIASASSTTVIAGIVNGTTAFGALSQVVGAAKKLGIQSQPATATAGVTFSPAPAVRVEDQFGNLRSADSGVAITAARSGGTGTLQGTLTANTVNGVATFNNVNHQVANTITILFNSGVLTSVASANIAVQPAAANHLAFTTQPGSTTAGSLLSPQPVVKSFDAFNNLSSVGLPANLTLSMTLIGIGPLQGTTTPDIGTAAGNGTATFTNLRVDAAETGKQLTASASGLTGVNSSAFNISAGPASKLVVQTQPGSPATAGVAFSPQPVVLVQDGFGNTITSNNGTVVTAARGNGLGTLQGTLTAATVNGVASFLNLSHRVANTIDVQFTAPSLLAATSSDISVQPAAATQLAFTTEPGSGVVGSALATQPVVKSQDAFGNLSAVGLPANLALTVSLTGGTGPLSGTTSIDIGTSAGNGVATFANLRVDTAGNDKALTASASGLANAVSGVFSVDPAATTTAAADQIATFSPAAQLVPLSASVNSALPLNEGTVTFTLKQGAATIGTPVTSSAVVGGAAAVDYLVPSATPAGSYTIEAAYNGTANYLASSDNTRTLSINPASQTLTFDPIADKTYGDPSFNVNAAASSGLAPTFSIVSGPATISGASVTITAVGTVVVRAHQAGSPNYLAAADVDRSFSVSPAALSVTANDNTRLYGGTDPGFTGTIVGIKNGDNITATYATAATVTSPVGNYAIVPTLQDPDSKLGNYSVTSNNGTLSITPAPLSVTAADATRLYGGTDPVFSGSITGIKNGDGITATYATAATVTSPVGNYAIVPTLQDPDSKLGNYSVTSNNGTLSITPAPLSVTAADATRLYGGTDPVFSGSITGIKNGDDITATYATAATVTSPVGNYAIVPTLQDPDSKLGNYSVTSNNGTLSITPAPLSVTAADATRLYGGTDPVFSGSITGIKNGDDITATYATAATVTSPVGNYAIVPTLHDPDSKLGNYSVTSNNGTLSITPAPLSVTAANKSRAYGAADPLFTGTITGIVNGDDITASYSSAATALSPVGPYAIVPTLHDPDSKLGNYSVTSNNGVLTISPASLTGTADNKSRAYGTANPTFTATYTGFVNGEDASIVTGELAGSTPADANSPVGTYPITVSGQSAPNYSILYVDGELTVTAGELTVSSDDQTRAYGAANPTLTGSMTGLQNGDNITASYSTAAAPASPVGSYPIEITLHDPDGKLANYTVIIHQGNLTVTTAALTVTADDQSRLYGAADPTFTGTITGRANGDNITATYTPAATALSPVGTYAIAPSLQDPDGKLGNYSVTSNNGTLTINKAGLSVTADDQSRAYGAANPTLTAIIVGLRNGDNITAEGHTTATPSSPLATYAIVPSLLDPDGKLGNYTVTLNNGSLTITAAALSVTANDQARVYGAANPLFTGVLTGVQNGDNITASYDTTATSASPVGTYAIEPTLNDPGSKLSNYMVTLHNGTLTVTSSGVVNLAGTVEILGNGDVRITGIGDGGVTYSIQASDDLINWQTIGSATSNALGAFEFTETGGGSALVRFYRVTLP